MAKKPHKQSPPKKPAQKQALETPYPPIMRLLDRWEALARNPQYIEDYKFYSTWEGRTVLERYYEDAPDVLAQLKQIEARKGLADLRVMPDPRKIPRIIKKVRAKAEKLVKPTYESKIKNRTRENEVLDKMEERLSPIWQKELTAVRQIFYKCPPTKYKGRKAPTGRMVPTDTGIRDRQFCMVEIDITGGTRAELLDRVGAIIDSGREIIEFGRSPQRGALKQELNHWEIYDQVKDGKTPHQIAKESLRTDDNAADSYKVAAMTKQVSRAYKRVFYLACPHTGV